MFSLKTTSKFPETPYNPQIKKMAEVLCIAFVIIMVLKIFLPPEYLWISQWISQWVYYVYGVIVSVLILYTGFYALRQKNYQYVTATSLILVAMWVAVLCF